MKLTIDIRDDWMEDRIRAGADDGSNDTEYDLLCEIGDLITDAARAAGMDLSALDALRQRRDDGEELNS